MTSFSTTKHTARSIAGVAIRLLPQTGLLRIVAILFYGIGIQTLQVYALRPCAEELALLAGNPSFQQLAERVLGPSVSDRLGIAVGAPTRLTLTPSDVENLFNDTNDPWMQRMGRYLLNGIRSDNITVDLVGDKKDTGYAAGTCWNVWKPLH